MSCETSAEAYVQSYASAMHTAQNPEVTISSCAAALGAHYLPGLIAFIFGHQTSFPTQDKWVAIIEQHLEKFEKSGLGYDIRLARSRVESVSASSAMCFVTWKILPKNGVEDWEWENVYGYRLGQDGKEGWEFIVSDNEVAGVMQRAPAFFSTT
jgi:hypothetical protein